MVGDTILPLTIFEQVKVSETNNKNLKQVLEEEMAEKTHNHDDSYYTKQEVDEKEQNLIETVEEITDEVYTKTEVDQKIKDLQIVDESISDKITTLSNNTNNQITKLNNTDVSLSDRIAKLETQIMFGTEEPDDGDTLEPGSIYMVFEE